MSTKPDRRIARRSRSTAPLGVVAAAFLLLGACAPATPTKPVEKDVKATEKDAPPPVKADEPPPEPNTDTPPPPPEPPKPEYPPAT